MITGALPRTPQSLWVWDLWEQLSFCPPQWSTWVCTYLCYWWGVQGPGGFWLCWLIILFFLGVKIPQTSYSGARGYFPPCIASVETRWSYLLLCFWWDLVLDFIWGNIVTMWFVYPVNSLAILSRVIYICFIFSGIHSTFMYNCRLSHEI